ncbi:MAG TPA: 30S ribosomal protein S20 [Acidimicrobiia bacterium]|jgi:small subunit ribosomal protein S20
MANIKSQMKRNRQNEKRRLRNKSIRSEVKTAIKKVLVAAEAGEPTDELFRQAQKKIDKAVTKGVLKPNTAARKKARLAARLHATKPAA